MKVNGSAAINLIAQQLS